MKSSKTGYSDFAQFRRNKLEHITEYTIFKG